MLENLVAADASPDDMCVASKRRYTVAERCPAIICPAHLIDAWMALYALDA